MTGSLNFEVLFNKAPNAYMLLDRDLNYVAVNDTYTRVIGRSREELIGAYLFDLFPGDPDDANVRQLLAALEKALDDGEPNNIAWIRYSIPRDTPEGRVFDEHFWSVSNVPIFDDSGEAAYVLLHVVNVTELQELKQELQVAKDALHPAHERGRHPYVHAHHRPALVFADLDASNTLQPCRSE